MEGRTIPLTCQDSKLFLQVRLGNTSVDFLVDSGANTSIIPYDITQQAGLLSLLEPVQAHLSNPVAQYRPTIHGTIQAKIEFPGGLVLCPKLVVMSPAVPILGLDVLVGHRCVLQCIRNNPSIIVQETRPETPLPILSKGIHIPFNIKGQQALALLDTGCTCCFMSLKQADKWRISVNRMQGGASTITGQLPIVGYTSEIPIQFMNVSTMTSFCVIDVEEKLVLGLNVLLDANMRLHFKLQTIQGNEEQGTRTRQLQQEVKMEPRIKEQKKETQTVASNPTYAAVLFHLQPPIRHDSFFGISGVNATVTGQLFRQINGASMWGFSS